MDFATMITLVFGFALGVAVAAVQLRSRRDAALHGLRAELASRLGEAAADNARLAATLEAERAHVAREREQLDEKFRALAASALESNNRQFLELARGVLDRQQLTGKAELEKRQVAIEHLVKPLRETLAKVETQFGELEKNRVGTERQLLTQMASLERTAGGLANALRAPKARGRWGEMHLRRVVEVAGMLEHCDFVQQAAATDGDGRRLQPDMVIRMAASKSIAVDAKTPLDSYLVAMETDDAAERERRLAEHAQRVRAHVRELRGKEYARHLDSSTTLVVLFLPTEDMFRVALEHDPTLLEYAATHDVALATPSTLIVLLRSVSQGWREEALAENAQRISQVGGELYNRICTLGEKFSKLGRSLNTSVKDYNQTLGSLEARVLPAARQLEQLDVPVNKQLEQVPPVEEIARSLRAEEFAVDEADVVVAPPLSVVGRAANLEGPLEELEAAYADAR